MGNGSCVSMTSLLITPYSLLTLSGYGCSLSLWGRAGNGGANKTRPCIGLIHGRVLIL